MKKHILKKKTKPKTTSTKFLPYNWSFEFFLPGIMHKYNLPVVSTGAEQPFVPHCLVEG